MNIPDYVDPTHIPLWKPFSNWCKNNGVAENYDDMKAWWDCFIAGATAMYLETKDGGTYK